MTDQFDFESRLEERLRARAALASRPFDAGAIARQAVAVTARRRTYGGLAWPWTRPYLGWFVMALLLAIALLGAVAAVGALLREPDPVPARITLAEQVIDAVNHRDVGSLRSSLAADAILEFPGVDARAGREGNVFMSDTFTAQDVAIWVGMLDKWGLEARLDSCRKQAGPTISCAVRTRWNVLQLEIGEEWTFDFDGARVTRLQMVRIDPDPPNRVLPLGLLDLDRWEAWLRETHPEQADHLLPTGPDLFGHWYFRFGLDASPDEIGASIAEYSQSRDPIVGSYVCSEDGNPDVTHLWDVREDGTIMRVSGDTREALSAGTWSRRNGRFFTDFQGGMTFFTIDGDRLIGPAGAWTCTRGNS
jgi:hypothetical protein